MPYDELPEDAELSEVIQAINDIRAADADHEDELKVLRDERDAKLAEESLTEAERTQSDLLGLMTGAGPILVDALGHNLSISMAEEVADPVIVPFESEAVSLDCMNVIYQDDPTGVYGDSRNDGHLNTGCQWDFQATSAERRMLLSTSGSASGVFDVARHLTALDLFLRVNASATLGAGGSLAFQAFTFTAYPILAAYDQSTVCWNNQPAVGSALASYSIQSGTLAALATWNGAAHAAMFNAVLDVAGVYGIEVQLTRGAQSPPNATPPYYPPVPLPTYTACTAGVAGYNAYGSGAEALWNAVLRYDEN